MNIALIGYGKMGRIIEEIALQDGHHVVLRIGTENLEDFTTTNLQKADVAIEFTRPDAAAANVLKCFDAQIPVVCGTTGWNDQLEQVKEAAKQSGAGFLHASNFSIGVNIFFEINKHLAAMMNNQPDYEVTLEEIHHTQKLDKPSGTAVTLAEQILERMERKNGWSLENTTDGLRIDAIREEGVPGTHIVRYQSAIDDIEITHTAHNRKGFAKGALVAAQFLVGKKGIFTMSDVLQLK